MMAFSSTPTTPSLPLSQTHGGQRRTRVKCACPGCPECNSYVEAEQLCGGDLKAKSGWCKFPLCAWCSKTRSNKSGKRLVEYHAWQSNVWLLGERVWKAQYKLDHLRFVDDDQTPTSTVGPVGEPNWMETISNASTADTMSEGGMPGTSRILLEPMRVTPVSIASDIPLSQSRKCGNVQWLLVFPVPSVQSVSHKNVDNHFRCGPLL